MGDLTTLALTKAMLGISGSTEDTILTRLVSSVSARMERYIGRTITSATYTAEIVDSVGQTRIQLRQYPITSVTTVVEDGTTLSASDYTTDANVGQLIRLSGTTEIPWASGSRIITVTYVAGYSTVPKDLEDAATQQAAHEWQKSKAGGFRLMEGGQQIGPGTTTYVVAPWVPGAEEVLKQYRRLC